MRKPVTTALFLFLGVPCAMSQPYYSQYFDGADTVPGTILEVVIDTSGTNIWQVGPPQKPLFHQAATEPNVLVTDTVAAYPVNDSSRFTIQLPEVVPWGIVALQWMQKLDMDQGTDGGLVEYSLDSGATWTSAFNNPYVYSFYGYDPDNVDTLASGAVGFTGTDTTWRDIWLCFDLSWLQLEWEDTLLFRFTFLSDSVHSGKEGWMIDNMLAHAAFVHTVSESAEDGYLHVYPNPAARTVQIETVKLMKYHVIERMELLDPSGRMVEQWSNLPTKFWFDASKYPAGQYFLKVETNLRSETVPLILGAR